MKNKYILQNKKIRRAALPYIQELFNDWLNRRQLDSLTFSYISCNMKTIWLHTDAPLEKEEYLYSLYRWLWLIFDTTAKLDKWLVAIWNLKSYSQTLQLCYVLVCLGFCTDSLPMCYFVTSCIGHLGSIASSNYTDIQMLTLFIYYQTTHFLISPPISLQKSLRTENLSCSWCSW